ncbi:MAG: hypothetical protein IJW77_07780 [Clostridia bacterium]|nr:hypothetical protein [Clostridia bacterium]
MLYHVSPIAGLKILQPRVSTHGKAYVYAVENMVTGLLFGVRHDDFDFIISNNEKGTPILYECYPDALKSVYQGKNCSVYYINDDGFQRNKTSWDVELVCENEVQVIDERIINDLYNRLLDEEKHGNLIIHRYEYCPEYRKRISNQIVDRLIRWEIDLESIIRQDNRFSTYYKEIVTELMHITDGHLLP